MTALKAGSAKTPGEFANSMASAIEAAMQAEWLAIKGVPMPSGAEGAQDRQMLFAAIAQGVLQYLRDHRHDITTTSVHDTSTGHTHQLEFTWEK